MTTSFADAVAPAHLRGLLGEIGDLKRIRSAGRDGSIAQRGFRQAWCDLAAGDAPVLVMRRSVAAALAAARLGDLDQPKLRELGLDGAATLDVLQASFDAVAAGLDRRLTAGLRAGLETPSTADPSHAPEFVGALEQQPRAGATCPGKPRLVLEPAENHAEHCWAVAIFGVLLSPSYDADPVAVFVAALAHHLHNARMPDSGFTGEMLLGAQLDAVCARATDHALGQLAPPLRTHVIEARQILPRADTPEGQAFHAADVIDRVMQIAQHLRAAATTIEDVLDELELVHDGPIKPFHDSVLAEMRLP